jgi:hypothetical protein
MVPNPWGKEESYDFDVTKADKLFDFLLEKEQIKLPPNFVKPSPKELKNKKFCKYHNTTSHGTNDCRAFRQHIQRAIQQGKLKFDTAQKMKIDDDPFPKGHNMVEAKLFKGKTKVLTSARAREARAVDPDMQISAEEFKMIKRRREQKKSRYEEGESSRAGAMKPLSRLAFY